MDKDKSKPPRQLTQPPQKVVLQSVNPQVQKPTVKPDKNVRVPEYHLENFSGGENEG